MLCWPCMAFPTRKICVIETCRRQFYVDGSSMHGSNTKQKTCSPECAHQYRKQRLKQRNDAVVAKGRAERGGRDRLNRWRREHLAGLKAQGRRLKPEYQKGASLSVLAKLENTDSTRIRHALEAVGVKIRSRVEQLRSGLNRKACGGNSKAYAR